MAKSVSFEAFWNNCVVGRSSVACRDDTGGRRWLMRIEEGSLLERLNQKRERRLSIIAAFRIFSLFTGCLQTCDYHLLYVLICWSYQATPACIGLKPLKIHYYVLCIVHCAWLRPQGLASSWLSAGQGLLCLL